MTDDTTNTRADNDLDSIEVGTPSKGGMKLYYDSRHDQMTEVSARIDKAVEYIRQAKEKLGTTP